MNFLAAYIMRGRMQAMIVASSLALLSLMIPPVSIVSSASVALVTLRLGAFEGLYVLACSSIAAGLLGLILLGNYQFALLYVIVLWLPVWLISIVLREGRHLSLAIEIAVLLGEVCVVGFYLYNPEIALMWKNMLSQMVQMAPANAPIKEIVNAIDIMSHYMTGLLVAGSVFSLLFGLFLGRWWQATLYNPGGFREEFLSLSTQPRLAIGSIIVIAVAWLSSGALSEVLWNTAILLFVLYAFIGTALLHSLLSKTSLARYAVPMFYLTMFLVPHVMLPIALVGLSDAWLNLRKKNSN
ncbi:MAG: hypothetical protein ACXWT3_10650 [Methylococcaceae bacterium]